MAVDRVNVRGAEEGELAVGSSPKWQGDETGTPHTIPLGARHVCASTCLPTPHILGIVTCSVCSLPRFSAAIGCVDFDWFDSSTYQGDGLMFEHNVAYSMILCFFHNPCTPR